MTFPFEILGTDARQLGLIVAVVIGFFFGFVLERAGFGRSTKLAAQFYLRDMTVFKVMFTAIVTAMLGLVAISALGFADLSSISQSISSWTYVWPMLAGGLVLGIGFIVSGYCPGTSLVAAGSGNIDGIVTVSGVVAGTFLYSELQQIPAFARFHNSGELGAVFLYELLGIPAQLLAVIIALAALAAFVGAEKVEQWMQRRLGGEVATVKSRPRRFAFATVISLAFAATLTLGMRAAHSTASTARAKVITAEELAHAVVDQPWTVRLLDLRPAAEFAKGSISGAENVEKSSLPDLGLESAPADRRLVLILPNDATAPAETLRYGGEVSVLRGGYDGWRAYALTPPAAPAVAEGPQMEAYLFRSALHQALTGAKQSAPPATAKKGAVARPKKKGGGCSA